MSELLALPPGITLLSAQLLDATARGDAEGVAAALAVGASPDATLPGSAYTALLLSCRRGHEACVKLLLAAGACPSTAEPEYGFTPLLAAADGGYVGCVEALLAAGADPQAATANGCMPLMAAALGGHAACISALLAAGADPNAASGSGNAALNAAAGAGHEACISMLLAAGANPNPPAAFPPLHAAAVNGHAGCVQALLAGGACPLATWSGMSALECAVVNNHPLIVRQLLQAAPAAALAPPGQGRLPLLPACFYKHLDPARLLLQLGALPTPAEVLEALHIAHCAAGIGALPLYAPLVARQPLTEAEWARVPAMCWGLGAALPAVLARSRSEATLLVRRLPPGDRARLRAAALCLERLQRQRGAAFPREVVGRILALALAK